MSIYAIYASVYNCVYILIYMSEMERHRSLPVETREKLQYSLAAPGLLYSWRQVFVRRVREIAVIVNWSVFGSVIRGKDCLPIFVN